MSTPQMPFARPTVFDNKYKYWKGSILTVKIPRKSIEGATTDVKEIEGDPVDYMLDGQATEGQSSFIEKQIRFVVAPQGKQDNTNDGTQATGALDLFFATKCKENLNGCYVYYRGTRYRLHNRTPSLVHHYEYVGTENGSATV